MDIPDPIERDVDIGMFTLGQGQTNGPRGLWIDTDVQQELAHFRLAGYAINHPLLPLHVCILTN
jgi:hypothetical protein